MDNKLLPVLLFSTSEILSGRIAIAVFVECSDGKFILRCKKPSQVELLMMYKIRVEVACL